jgi:hypothetical protein
MADGAKAAPLPDQLRKQVVDTNVRLHQQKYEALFQKWGTSQQAVDELMSIARERAVAFDRFGEQLRLLGGDWEKRKKMLNSYQASETRYGEKVKAIIGNEGWQEWNQIDAELEHRHTTPNN